MASIKEDLEKRARALGFDLFGVAPARPSATAAFFSDWLGAGYHGEMDYLARRARQRSDPGRLLPGAKSIICVGTAHAVRDPRPDATGLRGRVAAYAWGDDYHKVMGKKLKDLAAYLRERSGGEARCYVDTGPVLEREYAARAGLGWFGKSTNLIREGLGSGFLIGEILTDLDLGADSPVPDRCGTCTLCIDACPTGAILEPYLVDSTACISYLTIEQRGSIARELREPMGDWVFGCDVCQDVCPWNRKAPEGKEEAFRPREGIPRPDLIALLEMTGDEWKALSRGSAMKRAKRNGMRRNAAVALGNCRDPRGVPPLIRALGDPDPLIRGHAAWALGRFGDPRCEEALRDALRAETDRDVRQEIEAALAAEVIS